MQVLDDVDAVLAKDPAVREVPAPGPEAAAILNADLQQGDRRVLEGAEMERVGSVVVKVLVSGSVRLLVCGFKHGHQGSNNSTSWRPTSAPE